MAVKMLKDFRGKASREEYYKKGVTVKAGAEIEAAMVKEGVARKLTKAAPKDK